MKLYNKLIWLFLFIGCTIIGCTNKTAPQEPALSDSDRSFLEIVPLPMSVLKTGKEISLTKGIYVVPASYSAPLINASLERFVHVMKAIDVSTSNPEALKLEVSIAKSEAPVLNNKIIESYRINIDADGIQISADNYTGINHGLSTLTQLIYQSREDGFLPELNIYDSPRFSWRGLMIDVSRHWIPKEAIIKSLNAMSLVKMNVLHLHLSDDQGFRIESKTFPKLHELGSDGNYFTQEEMKEIIDYATELGIRIIPEFDMPGHTSSWLTAYPEIASAPLSYELQDKYGIYPNVMNPVSEKTYLFLELFFKEMAQLFKDEYIHIGADEVLPKYWKESIEIQDFIKANNLENLEQVQSYFILKIQKILSNYGKKMIAWDEALRMQIADGNPLIQAWRDQEYSFQAARFGINSILSKGWYLDHKLHYKDLYKVDPEYDPNAIDIIPDTNHWKIYKLEVLFRDQLNEGRLILFGENDNLTGVIQLMDRTSVINNARRQNDKLNFNYDVGVGEIKAELIFQDDKLKGEFALALFDLPVEGTLIGGNDVDGIELPDFNTNEPLTDEQKKLILGGEACMWSEWVDDKNILSRIWPSTAVIAEKLWSPFDHTTNVDDLYRRMNTFSSLLISCGIDYKQNQFQFIEEVIGDGSPIHMSNFIASLEEVKYYERWTFNPEHSIKDPLDRIADAAGPESFTSYSFGKLVEQLQQEGSSVDLTEAIKKQLNVWIPIYRSLESVFSNNEKLKHVEVLALSLSDLAKIALHVMESKTLNSEETNYYNTLKLNAQRKIDGVYLAPAPHIIQLIDSYLAEI